ncbi:hypothetical protein H2248_005404 [Termitomyces sp. 'cryptogamus']|nr:hypothetical protein H2248_005404 [Termitomyces sp. 'cryptogamus']
MIEIINETTNMLPLDADHKIGRAEESDAKNKKYSPLLLDPSHKSAEADGDVGRRLQQRKEKIDAEQKEFMEKIDRLMVDMEDFNTKFDLSEEERENIFKELSLKLVEAYKRGCAIMELSKITRVSQLPA